MKTKLFFVILMVLSCISTFSQITFSTNYAAPHGVDIIKPDGRTLFGVGFITRSSCRGDDGQFYLSRSVQGFGIDGKNCMVIIYFTATLKDTTENRIALFYLKEDYRNHVFEVSMPNGVLTMKTTDFENSGKKVVWVYPTDCCVIHPENVVSMTVDTTKKGFLVGQWVWTNNIFVGDGIYSPNRWDSNRHILPEWFNSKGSYGSGNRLYLGLVTEKRRVNERTEVKIKYFFRNESYESYKSGFVYVPEQNTVLMNW